MGKRGRPPKKIVQSPAAVDQQLRARSALASATNFGRKRMKTNDEHLPNLNLINLIGNSSVKSFLTVENFVKLPMTCRKQLLKLLPECDSIMDEHQKPKLASNALNNEYFTHACLDFKDRLLSGYLTPEGFAKDTKLNKSTLDKLDPWKMKHFEAYFGEKLKNVDYINDDVVVSKRSLSRKLSVVDPTEKPLKFEPAQKIETSTENSIDGQILQTKQRRGKGRPKKNVPEDNKKMPPENEKPLPKLLINFKKKTLSFFLDGQSSDVREWEESSRSTSQSPKTTDGSMESDQLIATSSLSMDPLPISSGCEFAATTDNSCLTPPLDGQTPEPVEPCDEEIESIEDQFRAIREIVAFVCDPPKALPVVSPQKISEDIGECLSRRAGSVPVTRSRTLMRKLSQ